MLDTACKEFSKPATPQYTYWHACINVAIPWGIQWWPPELWCSSNCVATDDFQSLWASLPPLQSCYCLCLLWPGAWQPDCDAVPVQVHAACSDTRRILSSIKITTSLQHCAAQQKQLAQAQRTQTSHLWYCAASCTRLSTIQAVYDIAAETGNCNIHTS